MSNPVEQGNQSLPGISATDETKMTPEQLALEFQGGNRLAFEQLVVLFQRPIFNLAYRMLNDYQDATDLTQEVFVKLYRALEKYRAEARFSTWLFAIAANACRNMLRRRKRKRTYELPAADRPGAAEAEASVTAADALSPSELLQRKEVREMVENAVEVLPIDFRFVITMRDIQGLSYEEIAAILQCSLGTVKSRLARARAMTKKRLQHIQPGTVSG